jgi:acetyl-CoA C-acetyltransferase
MNQGRFMREVVIVSGARSAIGNYMGSLTGFSAIELGVFALKGAIQKADIDKGVVQEVIAGQCNQAGSPGNSARHIAMRADLSIESFAFTVHQQFSSPFKFDFR